MEGPQRSKVIVIVAVLYLNVFKKHSNSNKPMPAGQAGYADTMKHLCCCLTQWSGVAVDPVLNQSIVVA